MHAVLEFLSTRFTAYVMALGVFSGLVCWLFLSKILKNEDFTIESKIAQYGGMAYIFFSLALYLLGRFSG